MITGFQYHGGPELIENINTGDSLNLIADPECVYDKYAVAIYKNETMLGYVPCGKNKHIYRLLRQQVHLICTITEVNPEREIWMMLQIEIALKELSGASTPAFI